MNDDKNQNEINGSIHPEKEISGKMNKVMETILFRTFDDTEGVVRKGYAKMFIFLHFVAGFFLLWSVYSIASERVHQIGEFRYEAALETLYLLTGVFWGNMGWDFYSRIKKGADIYEINDYLFTFTAPILFLLPLLAQISHVLYWADTANYTYWDALVLQLSLDKTMLVSLTFLLIVIRAQKLREWLIKQTQIYKAQQNLN